METKNLADLYDLIRFAFEPLHRDEAAWQKLEGVDPAGTKFPVRARVDGEGILIFRTKDGFRGVQRSCPHLNASLMDATPKTMRARPTHSAHSRRACCTDPSAHPATSATPTNSGVPPSPVR